MPHTCTIIVEALILIVDLKVKLEICSRIVALQPEYLVRDLLGYKLFLIQYLIKKNKLIIFP